MKHRLKLTAVIYFEADSKNYPDRINTIEEIIKYELEQSDGLTDVMIGRLEDGEATLTLEQA